MKAPLKNTLECHGRRNKDTEKNLIIQVLKNSKTDLTRRQLSELTGSEIATLCKILFKLVYINETIEISRFAPCKTTGYIVMHFRFLDVECQ